MSVWCSPPANRRNCATALIPLGITLMSAGSHTEPGGYTGAGKESCITPSADALWKPDASEWATAGHGTDSHRTIQHRRCPLAAEVADRIRAPGL